MTSCRSRDSTVPALESYDVKNMEHFERMDIYIPLDLEVMVTGGCDNLEVIPVFMKEIVLRKKLRPVRCSNDDLIHNIRPLNEVLVP